MRTVQWTDGVVELIDQTRLPEVVETVVCKRWEDVADAIVTMKVRGAPAIGVVAAMGMALAAHADEGSSSAELIAELERVAAALKATRPTAVNLAWAVDRMLESARSRANLAKADLVRYLELESQVIAREDVEINQAIGQNGAALIADGANVLTHCSTGALATVDWGTAVGVIRSAHEAGKRLHVWVDETRPRLQGARLNSWELQQLGIPFTLITDSMAAHFMQQGVVDLIIVGADRIAANGDTANKIGTYGLAVLAQAHGIPFYVAAPLSTIDPEIPTGEQIPIEERDASEITQIGGVAIAPAGVKVANPSFDVTPSHLIKGIITERGILRAPYARAIEQVMSVSVPQA